MGDKDFFLSPDDAQTLGDINYMRKSKRVRRTFPKTLSNKEGFAITTDTSSLEDRSNLYKANGNGNGNGNTNTTAFTTPTPTFEAQTFSQPISNGNGNGSSSQPVAEQPKPMQSEPPKPVEERRQQDDGMDMFRNMAKNIRRR